MIVELMIRYNEWTVFYILDNELNGNKALYIFLPIFCQLFAHKFEYKSITQIKKFF